LNCLGASPASLGRGASRITRTTAGWHRYGNDLIDYEETTARTLNARLCGRQSHFSQI
jgi:hypothetical protein